jgi:cytochrome c
VAWGEQLIRAYGCGACHAIPGIQRADSKVGPPLQEVRERVYIAGVTPNTPQNLTRWIEHPHEVDPRTAMPELGVTPEDARDIAAYLYSC